MGRGGEGKEKDEEEEEDHPVILKFNYPHVAGGEKYINIFLNHIWFKPLLVRCRRCRAEDVGHFRAHALWPARDPW